MAVRVYLILLTSVLVCPDPTFANDPEKAKREAERIERELKAEINDASSDVAELVERKDIDVDEIKSVLQSKLTPTIKQKLGELARWTRKLQQAEQDLLDKQKKAEAEVDKIRVLERKLSWAGWVQAGLGSGFLFALIGAVFQHRQQSRANEKHELEMQRLRTELDAVKVSAAK